MNSRERLICTLNHQQPDRAPVDMGSTPCTGIHASVLSRLRKVLMLDDLPVKVHEPFQIMGLVENDALKTLNIDVVGLWAPRTFYGYLNKDWKQWKLQDGTEVLVGGSLFVKENEKGDVFFYPEGDTSMPPSAKLPKGGYYFDSIPRQQTIDERKLNGKKDFIQDFPLFSDEDLRYYEKTSINLYNNSEFGIIGNFISGGLGDQGFWSGPAFKITPGIRKADDWYMAHSLYPSYINEVFDFQVEMAIKNLALYKEAVGNRIQAIFLSGTDFGTQRCEFISPGMFREIYKPHYKKVNDWIHKNTKWKIFYHTCGSIVNILDDLVEIGLDILNPVQCSAMGMDPQYLKNKYGNKLTFWGGGVDTQKTLPFGTPEEVKNEVLERLKIFSKDGGYVFNTIHNIQPNTPVENILAMFEALQIFNQNRE